MKVVVAPASFKGTFSAIAVADLLAAAVHHVRPDATVIRLPVADGGEGFADCFLSTCGGRRVAVVASDPRGVDRPSGYVLLPDGTAVVELAAASGLHLAGSRPDPSTASTFGVGTLLRHASTRAKRIIVGLGGSATNDAGCGLAAACGVVFRNAEGERFIPVGATLSQIASIDLDEIPQRLLDLPMTVACDVTNPLSGPHGAARVFAPQKGADDAMVDRLDDNLALYSRFLRDRFGFDAEFPGAGAAGGTTVALRLFFHATIARGIDLVLDLNGFDRLLEGASLVLTGEGKLDSQSRGGKAVAGVAARATAHGVPCFAVCGRIEDGPSPEGVTAALALFPGPVATTVAQQETPMRLEEAVARILSLQT